MTSVFISYSRRNGDFVRKLAQALEAEGRQVWVDWEDIPPSVEWWKEIQRGIEAANAFVFVISPDSVQSKVCRQEIEHAVAHSKRIVPIVYEEVKDPSIFDQMHPTIKAHNWIFFNDPEKFLESFKTLVETLDTDFEYVREHTRLLVRAREWEQHDRDPDYVLRGQDLNTAQAWLAEGRNKEPAASQLHVEYIVSSQKANAARQRTILGAVTLGLLVSLVLALLAVVGFREASNEADQRATAQAIAERRADEVQSLALADEAEDALETHNVSLAVILALQANAIPNPLPDAQHALATAGYHPGARARWWTDDSIVDVALSPDGSRVVSASPDGHLIVWDAEATVKAGVRLLEMSLGPTHTVTSLAISPNGQQVIVGTEDGVLSLWDITTGQQVQQWQLYIGPIEALAFHPSGEMVVTGGGLGDRRLLLWRLSDSQVVVNFQGHVGGVQSVAFSPDGTRLLSGGDVLDRQLVMWDVETGEMLFSVDAHTAAVNAIDVSADGRWALTASEDASVKLWDLDSGILRRSLDGHTNAVNSVAYSPDGLTAVSVSGFPENTLLVWDVNKGHVLYRLELHDRAVNDVVFLPGSLRVISASDDESLILWDVEHGAMIQRLFGHDDDINGVDFSPDGLFAISTGEDFSLILWNLTTREPIQSLVGHEDDVHTAVFSPDGDLAATGGRDGRTIIWNLNTGEVLHDLVGHTGWVNSVDFSPDGRFLLSGSKDKTIILWDVATGQEVRRFEAHTRGINSVSFSPDGNTFVSGGEDGLTIHWEVATGATLLTLEDSRGNVNSVAFHPNGQQVFVTSFRTFSLWDLTTGEIVRTYTGHSSTIKDLAINSTGNRALSGALDSDIILWNVDSGEEIVTFDGHRASVNSVTFSDDGRFALSGSNDDLLILWRIDTLDFLEEWTLNNRLVRDFVWQECQVYRMTDMCIGQGIAP